MNVIYISPHYPPHYQQFVESLARHNVRVLGITDQNEEQLPEELRRALTGHYKVDQLENYDQVISKIIKKIGNHRFFKDHVA